MPYEFYSARDLTFEQFLEVKYDYQKRVDRYVKYGMDWEEAHTRTLNEIGVDWWGKEKYEKKYGISGGSPNDEVD